MPDREDGDELGPGTESGEDGRGEGVDHREEKGAPEKDGAREKQGIGAEHPGTAGQSKAREERRERKDGEQKGPRALGTEGLDAEKGGDGREGTEPGVGEGGGEGGPGEGADTEESTEPCAEVGKQAGAGIWG